MKSNRMRIFVVVGVLLCSALVYGEQGIRWEQLRPEDQKALKSFSDSWESFPLERQQALQRGAERWRNMTDGTAGSKAKI